MLYRDILVVSLLGLGNRHGLQVGVSNKTSTHSPESSVRGGQEYPTDLNQITRSNLSASNQEKMHHLFA